jgi:hypothetical protein
VFLISLCLPDSHLQYNSLVAAAANGLRPTAQKRQHNKPCGHPTSRFKAAAAAIT